MLGGCLILISTGISLPSRGMGKDALVLWSDLAGKLGSAIIYGVFLFYGAELFPTSVRPQGMGITQIVTKIGAITVPFVIQAGRQTWWLSYVLILISLTLTIFCTMLLPETASYGLFHTTGDVEAVASDRKRNLKISLLLKSKFSTPQKRNSKDFTSQILLSSSP